MPLTPTFTPAAKDLSNVDPADVVSKLDGATIENAMVTFPIAEDLALTDGITSRDTQGNLYIHNGTDLGGNRVDGKVLRGVGVISVTSAATAAQVITLAETIIHTAENVNASEWVLSGEVKVFPNFGNWTGAITPRVGIYLVGGDGVPATQTSVNRGYNVAWDAAAQMAIIKFQNRLTMAASSIVSFGLAAVDGGVIVTNITGGTATPVVTKLALGTGIANTRSVTAGEVGVRLYAGLDIDSSGADSSGYIYYVADVRLERII